MSTTIKSDNSTLDSKLELRRFMLRQMVERKEPILVMDCFQGSGTVWQHLRPEFPVQSYWGLDVIRKKGRIKVDSARVLAMRGWKENVIDLDCYGSPWTHWKNMVRAADHDLVVFLTIGVSRVAGGHASTAGMSLIGLRFSRMRLPNAISGKMEARVLPYALGFATDHGLNPVEVYEAFPHLNARYVGVRLTKNK